ncbi:MAG: radical SAM protein [Candidatus Lokiarchaeota archaeon]|nr:radical SAM protein [Candidatus Lokiarchaeota archaeon]
MSFNFRRPDAYFAWKNEEILVRFKRYKGIIDGNQIARYLIAKTLECDFNQDNSLQSLENLLKLKSNEFNELLKINSKNLKDREFKQTSYIDLLEAIANIYLKNCIFCERKCKINRINGKKGYCLIPADSYVSSAFLHYGEESVLVPSGTIFFQGCNFGCVFCQNYEISQSWKGKKGLSEVARKVDAKDLSNIAENLTKQNALNINYVGGDPIPNIHTIIASLNYQTSNICQLWNSNFYLTNKSLSLLIDILDFWLPDFKYGNNSCGEKYSGVKNYFDVISRNLKRIHDKGSGEIIIRHLVIPNHVDCCSKPILEYIEKEIPKCVVNIMGQYRPEFRAYKYPEINQCPTSIEMQEVKNYADKLGILWEPVS